MSKAENVRISRDLALACLADVREGRSDSASVGDALGYFQARKLAPGRIEISVGRFNRFENDWEVLSATMGRWDHEIDRLQRVNWI